MSHRTFLARTIDEVLESTYPKRMGIVLEDVADGVAHLGLPYGEQNTNRGGNVHGGALASLLICGGSLAAAETQRSEGRGRGRVLNVAVSYLVAAHECDLTAVASCLRRGRDTAHVKIDACASNGRSVATALLTYRFDDECRTPQTIAAATIGEQLRDELASGTPRRMSGSPYGMASHIEVIREHPDGAAARVPWKPNEGRLGEVHEGAVTGLIDNCGALSSYCGSDAGYDQPGATVAMHVTFAGSVPGDLVGYSRLVSRRGTSFANSVEIASLDSGLLAAYAMVSYRIPGRPTRDA